MIDEVKALLAADELDAPELEIKLISGEIGTPVDADPALGETFGPWRLVRPLGRGGMGEVYLAERCDGAYEQQVALKVLKRGLDTDAVLHRFLRERRILASLNHPNIARLFDAGAAADGRPYLVMEYVQGQPIDAWCRERQTPLRQMLELMVIVCEAVHAAHRQQVVHRDLKPSNILVGEDGSAKLLDFGVAKLVGDEEADATQTSLGSAPLTPQYAAPEQLLGQQVTPATDVYALGILLYELLTGQLPRGHQNARSAAWAAQDDQPLTWPSAALRKFNHPLAEQKRAALRTRAKELDGDLDQIVLKALQRQPQRRYAAAAELADDLRRHLDGRPVTARPDSMVYRARKFVVRNWRPVSAAAAVAVALIAGSSVALWQAQHAKAESRRALAIKSFLLDIFEQNSVNRPDAAKARKTTAEELLALGANRILGELHDDPELRVDLLGTMAELYSDLSMTDRASSLLNEEIAELKRLHGNKPDLEMAKAHLLLAEQHTNSGRYAEASTELNEALGILDALGEQHSSVRVDALTLRGEIEYWIKPATDPSSRQDLQAAIDMLRIYDPKNPEMADAVMNLARTEEYAGLKETAEGHYRDAIRLAKSFGSRYRQDSLAAGYQLYGALLVNQQRYEQAIPLFRQAVSTYSTSLGSDCPDTLDSRQMLAFALSSSGNRREGLPMQRQVLLQMEQVRTASNDDRLSGEILLQARRNLAEEEYFAGDFASARKHLEENLAVYEREQQDSNNHASNLTLYTSVLTAQGELVGAQRALDRVRPIIEHNLGLNSYAEGVILTLQAHIAFALGHDVESINIDREALDHGADPANPLQPYRMSAAIGLARSLIANEKPQEAIAVIRPFLAALKASPLASDFPDQEASMHQVLGSALFTSGDAPTAEIELRQAVERYQAIENPYSPFLALARVDHAVVLHGLGRDEEARKQLAQAREAMMTQKVGDEFLAPLRQAEKQMHSAASKRPKSDSTRLK